MRLKNHGKSWTTEELNFIKKNAKEMTYAELAENLGRTKRATGNKVRDLGLADFIKKESKIMDNPRSREELMSLPVPNSRNIKPQEWRQRKEDIITLFENDYKTEEIAYAMGMDISTLTNNIKRLGMSVRELNTLRKRSF